MLKISSIKIQNLFNGIQSVLAKRVVFKDSMNFKGSFGISIKILQITPDNGLKSKIINQSIFGHIISDVGEFKTEHKLCFIFVV